MDYHEALQYLAGFTDFEQKTGYSYAASFGLERPRALLKILGDPHLRFHTVLVAGTKGKGSTAAMIASILQASGRRVGLYSQPHFHTFRERIRVDSVLITEDEMAAAVQAVVPGVEQLQQRHPELGPPTTYEVATAAAMLFFARRDPGIVVLEIGLGGRLDAVNVAQPLVSVITPISLDHVQILGDAIAQIAAEKAGIIKEGGTVVAAAQSEEALAVIRRTAEERAATLIVAEPDVVADRSVEPRDAGATARPRSERTDLVLRGPSGATYAVRMPLLGAHQVANAATAIAAAEQLSRLGVAVSTDDVERGLVAVRWPGRLEVVSRQPLVVVDGAHNADSAEKLAAALRDNFVYRRLILVLGTSTDKDVAGIIAALGPASSAAVATRSHHTRAADPDRLAAELRRHCPDVWVAPDVASALALASSLSGPGDMICATGSLYTVADAREHYGLAIEKD